MIPKIKYIKPQKDYKIEIQFEDNKKVIYDVKKDIETLPGYIELKRIPSLFEQVKLDKSKTCIYWNRNIDLPSDILYEYGEKI